MKSILNVADDLSTNGTTILTIGRAHLSDHARRRQAELHEVLGMAFENKHPFTIFHTGMILEDSTDSCF